MPASTTTTEPPTTTTTSTTVPATTTTTAPLDPINVTNDPPPTCDGGPLVHVTVVWKSVSGYDLVDVSLFLEGELAVGPEQHSTPGDDTFEVDLVGNLQVGQQASIRVEVQYLNSDVGPGPVFDESIRVKVPDCPL